VTWVKVCGLTTEADVQAAVAAGADAVGFVNIRSSPRFIPVTEISRIAAGVEVHRILLTRDVAPEAAAALLAATGMSGIQPYGARAAEAAAAAAAAGYFVLQPVPVDRGFDLSAVEAGIPLLDTAVAGSLGGTGKVFNWELAAGIETKFVLAGGLGPANVAAAIGIAAPWGVDASSGLESAPGVKDHSMVAAFVAEAKRT
jgi:phosphoribosylanthranilate isomerase